MLREEIGVIQNRYASSGPKGWGAQLKKCMTENAVHQGTDEQSNTPKDKNTTRLKFTSTKI